MKARTREMWQTKEKGRERNRAKGEGKSARMKGQGVKQGGWGQRKEGKDREDWLLCNRCTIRLRYPSRENKRAHRIAPVHIAV